MNLSAVSLQNAKDVFSQAASSSYEIAASVAHAGVDLVSTSLNYASLFADTIASAVVSGVTFTGKTIETIATTSLSAITTVATTISHAIEHFASSVIHYVPLTFDYAKVAIQTSASTMKEGLFFLGEKGFTLVCAIEHYLSIAASHFKILFDATLSLVGRVSFIVYSNAKAALQVACSYGSVAAKAVAIKCIEFGESAFLVAQAQGMQAVSFIAAHQVIFTTAAISSFVTAFIMTLYISRRDPTEF